MPFYVVNYRTSRNKIEMLYPGSIIIDVTSRGAEPWIKFSPFYPHGELPVPFSPGCFGMSVEGIWQGLKVFEKEDIDCSKMQIVNMKGIKRSGTRSGKVLGHRKGINGETLLSYLDARLTIYLPTYRWVLEKYLNELITQLRELETKSDVILLDFNTNSDVYNLSKPLSHASLIIHYISGTWPVLDMVKNDN